MENDIITSSQIVKQKFDRALRFRFDENAKVENFVIGIRFTKYYLSLTEEYLSELNTYKSEFAVLTEKCSNVEFCVESGKIVIFVQNEDFNEKEISYESMVQSKEFLNAQGVLTFPIGRNFDGKIVVGDLKNLGCVLSVGFVGSGNSEIIEGMILSFTSKYSPDEFKLILVEPRNYNLKTFDIFEPLPHLLGGRVFKEDNEILKTLSDIVTEINRRNDVLSNAGVPTIELYNNSSMVKEGKASKIPYVLVVINKFENVIAFDKTKIEKTIQILTAKAKSCGIYLVIATEKPTVDVLTTIVTKHINSKIIFKTKVFSSKYISVLPEALNLFPRGDMYYLPFGVKSPIRLQYPYIDFNDCKKMVLNIANHYKK